jgi:hypothetical protein
MIKKSSIKESKTIFSFTKACAFAACMLLAATPFITKAQVDPLEYPPGHPNVTVSAIDQLQEFPTPRYRPGHTLLPNYNVIDPIYFGSRFQSGVSDAQAVTNSVTIQTELARNFNYMVNVTWSGDPWNTAWINLANANPQWKVAMMTLRAQVGGSQMWNQNFASDHYLQNSSGQFLGWSGNIITSNKTWRPTAPVADYAQDGNTVKNWVNGVLGGLTRPVDLVNEDGEVYPIIETQALQMDPAVTSAKNASGLDWQPYLAKQIRINDNAYSTQFMTTSHLSSAKYTEYRLDGHRNYQLNWDEARFINSPINGQYYATSDLYVRWPYNWQNWVSAWHGLKWVTESRYYELAQGDKLFSPFVAAGWDANPETDVRPAQWLGLMKIMGMYGAEFYYAGYFNEASSYNPPNPPPNDPKGYAWQAVVPSYAQAVTSRFEADMFRNGSLMAGDMTDNSNYNGTQNEPVPFYQFNTGASNKVVVIRKSNSGKKYAITGAIENTSNVIGSTPLIDDAAITLDGGSLKFKVRRQGSTYIYDNTNSAAPVFYQLDGWHESSHPWYWSKDFTFEAEVYDNTNVTYNIKTTVPAGTQAGDYRAFTSFITFPDAQTSFTPIEYTFTPRDAANTKYYLWIKMRSRVDGATTGLTVSMDNANAKTIGCASDTTWKWYSIDATSQQAVSFNNLSLSNHTLRLTPDNSKLEIDQIILTNNTSLNLTPAGPATCSVINCPATATPNGPLTFCQGGSVTLTASSGSSYLWTPNGETTQSITANASGSYSVTVVQSNGCSATSSALNVSVGSASPASITADGSLTFCSGGSVVLTASAGSSYLWSPNGETSQSVTVSSSGVYSVVVTNSFGCSSTSPLKTVTVNNSPPATITPNGPLSFCDGGNVQLTASTGTFYLWAPNNETTQTITATSSGTYSVTVGSANGCTSISTPVNVSVSSQSTPTITPGGPTTFCQGGSVVLDAGPGNSYLWSPGGQTAQAIIVNSSGNYSVVVSNAAGCSAASAPVGVTVNPLPIADITASGPLIFNAGDSVVLTSSSGSSYLWSPDNQTTQSITVYASGSYSVNVTDANGCSAASTPSVVFVNGGAQGVAYITAGGPTAFCDGDNVTLSANAGISYLWSTGETTQSITVSTAGSYVVTVQFTSNSSTSDPVNVVVHNLPDAIITPDGPTSFCQGGNVTLTSSNGYSYLWTPNGETTKSITVNSSGTYTVTVTKPSGCSRTSDPVVVSVNPLPTPVITAGGPLIFNQGDSVVLTSSAANGYLWSLNNETTQSITVYASGTYTVIVTDANGCTGASAPVVVTVNGGSQQTAVITTNGPSTFCQGGSVTLTANAGIDYLWSTGETTQSITATSSGSYVVTVTFTSNTSVSIPVDVVVNPLPIAEISPNGSTTFCQGSTLVLTATPGNSYLWTPNGETTQSITTAVSGSFTVNITDGNGCSATSLPSVVSTTNCNTCPIPTGLDEINITADSATLTWNPVAGVDSLQIWLVDVTGFNSTLIGPISGLLTQYTVSVDINKLYLWWIRSRCGNSHTAWSAVGFFSTGGIIQRDSANNASLPATGTLPDLHIFPNPASGSATVSYTALNEGTINMQVMDFTGKIIKNESHSSISGTNQYPVDLRNLPKGVYTVIINDNGKVITKRLVVN